MMAQGNEGETRRPGLAKDKSSADNMRRRGGGERIEIPLLIPHGGSEISLKSSSTPVNFSMALWFCTVPQSCHEPHVATEHLKRG